MVGRFRHVKCMLWKLHLTSVAIAIVERGPSYAGKWLSNVLSCIRVPCRRPRYIEVEILLRRIRYSGKARDGVVKVILITICT